MQHSESQPSPLGTGDQRGGEVQAATDPTLAQSLVQEEASEDIKAVASLPLQAEALLSVSWMFPTDQSASQGQPDYLDGSCLIYAEERLLDVVDFRGAHSATVGCHGNKTSSASYEWSAGRGKAAGVLHSGDVMSSEGGTHVIRLRLADLPACATDCFFATSAYNCRDLSLFRSLDVRLVNAEHPTRPLFKFSISDVPGRASCVVVCALRRRLGQWEVRSAGRSCDATVRDYTPVEATIAPFQEGHIVWRRRRPLLLLAQLLQSGRALPVGMAAGGEAGAEALRPEEERSAKRRRAGAEEGQEERPAKRRRAAAAEEGRQEAQSESALVAAIPPEVDIVTAMLQLPAILFHGIVQYV